MLAKEEAALRQFGKCTHGRNWGIIGHFCEAEATHQRKGFPDRLACDTHATHSAQGWLPISPKETSHV